MLGASVLLYVCQSQYQSVAAGPEMPDVSSGAAVSREKIITANVLYTRAVSVCADSCSFSKSTTRCETGARSLRWARYLGGGCSRRENLDRSCCKLRVPCCHALLYRLRVDARRLAPLVDERLPGCIVCVCGLLAEGSLKGDTYPGTKDVSCAFMRAVSSSRAVRRRRRYLPSVWWRCCVMKRQRLVLQLGGRPCSKPSRRNSICLLIDHSLCQHGVCVRRACCLSRLLWCD